MGSLPLAPPGKPNAFLHFTPNCLEGRSSLPARPQLLWLYPWSHHFVKTTWRRRGVRVWDGWVASPMQWTWTWANSRRWWGTGRPGVLQSTGLQRVRQDWATEQTTSLPGGKIQWPLPNWQAANDFAVFVFSSLYPWSLIPHQAQDERLTVVEWINN